ncbi:TonB-dependent receptor [Cognatilysobacter lacus]|uniref:TonB-dependent receptor n=1 Tax=Cognatilysobacter lacus TaxID=1643323 RepID=A0A5D8YWJ8_9GAMM|nr:TonB-dependent receptor [Lysobacter lacus]TZF86730.1 TonB-dependent receptor [Lysobacter lacus]
MNLKRNLLSVALASAALMAASAAQAQTATSTARDTKSDAKQLDSVHVKGIRRGIERSIDTKKNSTSIVEAVSAEDIGKLPDVSIAESIARLPGLAAQRVAGRAQVISVRGLSPDFSTTLLNGREMVSTGDNRSVEFDQYPSELLSGVTVYKTPDAGLIGQGLSGTIDMQTVRPLNFQDRVIAVSARGQHNSLGAASNQDAFGNRFNASYIDQFANRTWGVVLGYSHSDTPIQENQVGLYEPWQQLGANWRPGVPAGTFYSDGIKALRRTGYQKRDAIMGTLEFRPNDAWRSTLDVLHSEAHQEDTANQFEVNLSGYNGTNPYVPLAITNAQVNGNGTFTGGTVANVYPLVRAMYNDRKDKIDAFGWNNQFNVGAVKLSADASWSRAKRNELNLENNTQLASPALDTLGLQIRADQFSQINPTRDYSDPAKLFVTNTIYGSGYGKAPRVVDELKSYRLDANFAAPQALRWIKDFDVGINYADRKKEKHQPEANINLGPQGATTIPADLQYGLVDLGFAGVGYIPSWNVPGVVSRFMTFNPSETAAGYLVAKAWTVNEKITTTYAKANIDTQLGSVPVRGNVGVQVQHTDQSSSGLAYLPPGVVTPYTTGKKYSDVLPSTNLAFSLPYDQTVRVALAKQVARPRVDQMRASLDFGVDTNTGKPGGSTGNALLDPWRANAFDVSYEKYFGSKAYVAAAYFYKDLTSYIVTQTDFNHDYTTEVAGYVPPASCNGNPCPAVLTHGSYTRPVNGKGGKLQGLELTASLPLDMFAPALRGFGVVASASFTDSNISIPPDPDQQSSVGSAPIALPGLSKRVYNFTAYYENNGFEARINNRRRSDFIGEIGNFNGNRTLRYVVGENITDAQVSYTFGDDTSLKGLSLLLQANNLTNEAYRTYAGTKDRPLENIEWGRTYLLGVSYKF